MVYGSASDGTIGSAGIRQPETHELGAEATAGIRQSGLTCWAAAMASWLLVKDISNRIRLRFLIRHYRGTECTDASDALVAPPTTISSRIRGMAHPARYRHHHRAGGFRMAMAKRLIRPRALPAHPPPTSCIPWWYTASRHPDIRPIFRCW
jgi:hypothetical protein